GQQAAIELLQSNTVPEAVFATNDFSAIGAMGIFRERGLRIPEDIAVAGFNDTPLAPGVNLTTVRSPMHDIGRLGLETLLRLMNGDEARSVKLDPQLIVRASSSSAAQAWTQSGTAPERELER